jgi:hypothetical protein
MIDDIWIRRRAAIVAELDFPEPFDLAEFAARLGRRRGRPLRLYPVAFEASRPCGLWIATTEADYVYYETGTTPFHAMSIALHQIAHLLLGHQGLTAWHDLARWQAPGADPAVVQIVFGRADYSRPEERDAETLASLMLERATAWPQAGGWPRLSAVGAATALPHDRHALRALPPRAAEPDGAA